MHSLPHYQHPPPEWRVCSHGWTHMNTSQSLKVHSLHEGLLSVLYLLWVWTNACRQASFLIISCRGCFFLFLFLVFCLFRVTPTAYGGSQVRGQIGAAAAGLYRSHSNMGSELCLWPTPQLTARLDPEPTEHGQGWNLSPHGYWMGSLTTEPRREHPVGYFYCLKILRALPIHPSPSQPRQPLIFHSRFFCLFYNTVQL